MHRLHFPSSYIAWKVLYAQFFWISGTNTACFFLVSENYLTSLPNKWSANLNSEQCRMSLNGFILIAEILAENGRIIYYVVVVACVFLFYEPRWRKQKKEDDEGQKISTKLGYHEKQMREKTEAWLFSQANGDYMLLNYIRYGNTTNKSHNQPIITASFYCYNKASLHLFKILPFSPDISMLVVVVWRTKFWSTYSFGNNLSQQTHESK